MTPRLSTFIIYRDFPEDGTPILNAMMPTKRVAVKLPTQDIELRCYMQFLGLTGSHVVSIDVVQPKHTIVGHHEFRIDEQETRGSILNKRVTVSATFARPGHHHVQCYLDGALAGTTQVTAVEEGESRTPK